jgi:tetratricopeptide (TPR) repeat protein/predicted Ser/Thr protein kinase
VKPSIVGGGDGCIAATTLGDYFAERLSSDDAARASVHVAGCETCKQRLKALRSSSMASGPTLSEAESIGAPVVPLENGTQVNRYLIVKQLGQGGMGVVYAAYDPQLDRRVALKLLRRDVWGGSRLEDGRTRLLREAQAMARLSHPNVVSVFDVGTNDGQLYVAMDFIDGVTLRHWLTEAPRTPEQIVSVFVDAARGLAAAHAVGLIHRDFKPENVLCSAKGRVCVADFGLARSASERDAQLRDSNPRKVALGSESPVVTQTGLLLGTPAYMAPEQYRGEHADERTDQFSFCVALYESLYGEHPFGGSTFTELITEVSKGRVRPTPSGSRVPDRLRQIVLRGMATSPADRFPSMDALIADLAPRPRGALRRRFVVAAALGVAALVAVVVYQARRPALLCRGSERKLAGVWDDARKKAIRYAFAATNVSYADEAWQSVERAFDAYTRTWVSTRTEACEATRVRGEQSEQLLDLRMTCLDNELAYASSLSTIFAHADPSVIEYASASANSLPGIDRCSNTKQLMAHAGASSAEVVALEAKVADVRALLSAGRRQEASKAIVPLVEAAQKLRDVALTAEAIGLRGRIEMNEGDMASAAATLKSALLLAESANDDERVALLWSDLMRAYVEQGKFTEAEDARQHGDAFVQRLADPALPRAELEYTTGVLYAKSSKYELARTHFANALAIWEKRSGPESRDAERAVGALATVASTVGDNTAAIALAERALAIDHRLLGRFHPDLVSSEGTLASAFGQAGRMEQGFAHYRAALEIAEHTLAPDDPALANALGNWASTELATKKRYAEALTVYARVLKIQETHFGADAAIIGQTLSNIASIETQAGKLDDAAKHLERALSIEGKALGPEHDEVARTLSRLGEVANERHQYGEALPLFQRAIAIFEKTVDKQSLDLLEPIYNEGVSLARLKRNREALASFERALSIKRAQPIDADAEHDVFLPELRFERARVLWALGEHARAVEDAKFAHDFYVKGDLEKKLPAIDAFLRQAHANP